MPGAGGIRAMIYLQLGRAEGRHHHRPRAFERAVRAALRHQRRQVRSAPDELDRQPQCRRRASASSGTRRGSRLGRTCSRRNSRSAAPGAGSQMETMPAMLNKLFGTKIKIISGYKGGNEIYLAMERGEVDGRCGGLVSSISSTRPDWFPQKKVAVPIADRARAQSAVPGRAGDRRIRQGRSAAGRCCGCSLAPQDMDRPFLAPPGVPAERVAALAHGVPGGFQRSRDSTPMPPAWGLKSQRSSGEKAARMLSDVYALPATSSRWRARR